MNAARKVYAPVEPPVVQEAALQADKHWFKVLCALLLAALFATATAVASVWLKLEIDRKFQKIDEIKIRNAQLQSDIDKLEANVMQLKSLDKISKDLEKAGVAMDLPRAVFFVDPSEGTGSLALSGGDKNGQI